MPASVSKKIKLNEKNKFCFGSQGFEDSNDMATTGSCVNSIESHTSDTNVADFVNQIHALAQLAGWAEHRKYQVCRVKLVIDNF